VAVLKDFRSPKHQSWPTEVLPLQKMSQQIIKH